MEYIRKLMHGFENDGTVEVSYEFKSVGWDYVDIMMLSAILKE